MKNKNTSGPKPRGGGRGGGGGGGGGGRGGGAKRGKKSSSLAEDPFFFGGESKKRRKMDNDDGGFIDSGESDDDFAGGAMRFRDGDKAAAAAEDDDEFAEETADERRKRLAVAQLERMRESLRREKEEEDDDEDEDDEERIKGERDSLVAHILQQKQQEDSGRVRRSIASRVQEPEASDHFRVLVKHRQTVSAVALSEDDFKGFSASKDGTIMHWDVDSGKSEKYKWPSFEILRSHGVKDPQGRATKHSKTVLALAVSSDGRYLATGGSDRHVHLWDTRTREHIQAFPGHKGPVSCVAFRQGTLELFSGSFDRTIRIWNAEDRCYINSLYGHQSEILTIDCLRKERVLTVGRDRTMQFFKVPEETRSVFRATAPSLECCCFLGNDDFLTGSDDGSVELWSALRKKPVFIARKAHALLSSNKALEKDNGRIPNGHLENGDYKLESFDSSLAYSWVGSVASCRNSDLAASGAGNGSVRLWSIESERKDIQPLYNLPLVGFVNSLAFSNSGEFLVAGVGQEPRLGRWGRITAAQNGVAVHSLKLS